MSCYRHEPCRDLSRHVNQLTRHQSAAWRLAACVGIGQGDTGLDPCKFSWPQDLCISRVTLRCHIWHGSAKRRRESQNQATWTTLYASYSSLCLRPAHCLAAKGG